MFLTLMQLLKEIDHIYDASDLNGPSSDFKIYLKILLFSYYELRNFPLREFKFEAFFQLITPFHMSYVTIYVLMTN